MGGGVRVAYGVATEVVGGWGGWGGKGGIGCCNRGGWGGGG